MFCKYKDVLGKLKKGIHSYRFLNIAIMDVILTVIGAYLLNLLIPNVNYFRLLLFLFLLGILLHRVFCVRTTIDKLLF